MIQTVDRFRAALLFIAAIGCRDSQPRGEGAGIDTSAALGSPVESRGAEASDSSGASALSRRNPQLETTAADVVRRYYDAITAGQYDSAYALWEGSGEASGQTRTEFANGFKQTVRTVATIGDRVRVEGAAGSQYITVPVTVDATLKGGALQHFVGTYVLRRAIADGATAEQQRWHIYSAHLRQANPPISR